ncbi:MAG: hypothetical protein WA728_25470 [Xanthobacteraceae bacterium]
MASTDTDWRGGNKGLTFLFGLALLVAVIAALRRGSAGYDVPGAME